MADTTSSVAHGHGVGRILAIAWVEPEAAYLGKELKVVIIGKERSAGVPSEPAYDLESKMPRMDGHRQAAKDKP